MDAGIVFRVCVRERADELVMFTGDKIDTYPRKSAYYLLLLCLLKPSLLVLPPPKTDSVSLSQKGEKKQNSSTS